MDKNWIGWQVQGDLIRLKQSANILLKTLRLRSPNGNHLRPPPSSRALYYLLVNFAAHHSSPGLSLHSPKPPDQEPQAAKEKKSWNTVTISLTLFLKVCILFLWLILAKLEACISPFPSPIFSNSTPLPSVHKLSVSSLCLWVWFCFLFISLYLYGFVCAISKNKQIKEEETVAKWQWCENVWVWEQSVKKNSWVIFGAKSVVLLKNGDRAHRQKEMPWGQEEWLIIYFQVRRQLGIAQSLRNLKTRFLGSWGASYR